MLILMGRAPPATRLPALALCMLLLCPSWERRRRVSLLDVVQSRASLGAPGGRGAATAPRPEHAHWHVPAQPAQAPGAVGRQRLPGTARSWVSLGAPGGRGAATAPRPEQAHLHGQERGCERSVAHPECPLEPRGPLRHRERDARPAAADALAARPAAPRAAARRSEAIPRPRRTRRSMVSLGSCRTTTTATSTSSSCRGGDIRCPPTRPVILGEARPGKTLAFYLWRQTAPESEVANS